MKIKLSSNNKENNINHKDLLFRSFLFKISNQSECIPIERRMLNTEYTKPKLPPSKFQGRLFNEFWDTSFSVVFEPFLSNVLYSTLLRIA